MSKRAETASAVAELHAQGLNGVQIAERLQISRSYTYELLNDPSGSEAKIRKARYGRPCIDCGTMTDGTNGRGKAAERCGPCRIEYERQNPLVRADLRGGHPRFTWTDEQILDAIRVVADHPTVNAYHDAYQPGRMPSVPIICRRFESWNAAVRAAGLTPSGKRSPQQRKVTRREVERALLAAMAHYGRPPTHDEYDHFSRGTDYPCSVSVRCKIFDSWGDATRWMAAQSMPLEVAA